jgi:hypothetical protein
MSLKKLVGLSLAAIVAMSLSVVAMADDGVFADGAYTLTLPGLGVIDFTVATEGDETTVTAAATPGDYEVVDKSDSKESFENGDGLTIELKPSKVEADVVWTNGAEVSLALPDGGKITVTFEGGEFDVTASDGWTVEGSGGKWFVSNDTYRFKVEVDEDGVALKVADDDDDSAGDDAASNDDDDSSDDDDDSSDDDSGSDDDSRSGEGKKDKKKDN